MACHAEASSIVNHNQVRAALFNELCADARPRTCGDNRFTALQGGIESRDDFFARIGPV